MTSRTEFDAWCSLGQSRGALPSANAARVAIGSRYAPDHFEQRTPTSYAALRPEPGADAARLQRALLARRLGTLPTGRRADRLVALFSAVALPLVLLAIALHWI